MDKLFLEPVQADYATQPPTEIIAQQLDGGQGRYRADVLGGSTIVNVSWILEDNDYQYLWAFFRAKTNRGATAFLIDLILEEPVMTERTVNFIPASLKLDGKSGDVYSASAQLEVQAIPEDVDLDNSLVDIWEATGGVDMPGYLNLFNIIVNVNWPFLDPVIRDEGGNAITTGDGTEITI